jgi:pimeloyl-ACP methyl ester carboxylesterase
MKRFLLYSLIGFLVLLTALVLFLGVKASTRPFRGKPNSIAVLEPVMLGGMEQWLLIRGEDSSTPVLLWLHGGPGSPQMPLAHHLDEHLEKHFVVVHWDQRGAGKSNPRGFDEGTMTFEQFLSDAHELTHYLKQRFGVEKIVLLGHSWGTHLGLPLVSAYPQDYQAYIGVSQVVDNVQAVEIAYDWLENEMARSGDEAGLEKLAEIGDRPYTHAQYRQFAPLVDDYGGSFDWPFWRLTLLGLQAREYTISDYVRMLNGMTRGGKALHHGGEMLRVNFIADIPRIEVPVYFLQGAHDYNTPLALVEEYYQVLEAPHKELIIFENAAHTPFLADNDAFSQAIINLIP